MQHQQASGVHAGSRMVVAKPLHPNQTLPPSIRTNLVSLAGPVTGTSEQRKGVLASIILL